MHKSLLLTLVASTALATGAFAQSSSTGTDSSTTTTGQSGTSVITPDTNSATGTSGSSASGSTGTSESGSSQDSNIAGQNPNPNIYGGNRGNTQQGSGDDRYAQQYQNQEDHSGQGMNPWAYHSGHHVMMQQMMQSGMGMVCMTPAPSVQGPAVPGSFACFPSQHRMEQGMGHGMGMGNMGGHQMGQYGFNPYGRNFDNAQRYGWNQGGYNPYDSSPGFNQYGQNFGPGSYGYGSQYGSNDGIGATSPNWYYENRQRQFSRSNDDYDRDRYGSSSYGSNYGRSNSYDSDTTGSMSRPGSNTGNYDYRSNDRSSPRYYDDQRDD